MLSAEKIEAKKYLQQVSDELDSDIFVYDAKIDFSEVNYFITKVREIRKSSESKSKIVLFLTTSGGDVHSAFKLAKFLKRVYDKLILFVFSYCKSAGTLLSIASDEIVMSEFGELGPLDIQINKEDDLKRESILNMRRSLNVIGEQASEIFEQFLTSIYNSNSGLTNYASLKALEDIAARISTDLLKPISSQIEPARLGALDREMSVVRDYGARLNEDKSKIIESLIKDYPSHDFVIDYEETCKLFGKCVRQPTEIENKLIEVISKEPYRRYREYRFIGSLEELLEQIPVEDEPEIEGGSNSKSDISGNGSSKSHTEDTEEADGLAVPTG